MLVTQVTSALRSLLAALTLANGGLVVLATGATDMAPHVNLHVLLHIGPDGREVARRLMVFPAEEHELFPAATSANEIGLVSRPRRGTALTFHPIGGGEPRAMGDLHTPGGACDRACETNISACKEVESARCENRRQLLVPSSVTYAPLIAMYMWAASRGSISIDCTGGPPSIGPPATARQYLRFS